MNILNHFADDSEDEEEVPGSEEEKERVVRYRKRVDDFMMYHFTWDPLTPEDYEFEGNCLYLNFEPPMDAAGHIYDSAMVREFIDAVNFLLGMNKYIVSYAVY